MVSPSDHGVPAPSEPIVVGDILGPRERLDFEHLLQWLRLSFLLTPILVLLAFGAPGKLWIAGESDDSLALAKAQYRAANAQKNLVRFDGKGEEVRQAALQWLKQ